MKEVILFSLRYPVFLLIFINILTYWKRSVVEKISCELINNQKKIKITIWDVILISGLISGFFWNLLIKNYFNRGELNIIKENLGFFLMLLCGAILIWHMEKEWYSEVVYSWYICFCLLCIFLLLYILIYFHYEKMGGADKESYIYASVGIIFCISMLIIESIYWAYKLYTILKANMCIRSIKKKIAFWGVNGSGIVALIISIFSYTVKFPEETVEKAGHILAKIFSFF